MDVSMDILMHGNRGYIPVPPKETITTGGVISVG